MPKAFISEDDIEQSILDKLEEEHLGYDILRLDPSTEKMDVLPDGTGRTDKKECVLPDVLWDALKRLNPNVKVIKSSLKQGTGLDEIIKVIEDAMNN